MRIREYPLNRIEPTTADKMVSVNEIFPLNKVGETFTLSFVTPQHNENNCSVYSSFSLCCFLAVKAN